MVRLSLDVHSRRGQVPQGRSRRPSSVPLEVATGSLWLGRARGETLIMSPRYAEGVEERFHQPATIRPVLGREIVPSGTPRCNPAWRPQRLQDPRPWSSSHYSRGYGEIHLWRSAFQQPFGQVIFQEGAHLVVDSLRFARRENQGVAGQSSDGVEPCAVQCGLGG